MPRPGEKLNTLLKKLWEKTPPKITNDPVFHESLGHKWSLGSFLPLFFFVLAPKDRQFLAILRRKVKKIKNPGKVLEILQIYC